jgi:TonB-linked SusC/RagA family outer membrane protein
MFGKTDNTLTKEILMANLYRLGIMLVMVVCATRLWSQSLTGIVRDKDGPIPGAVIKETGTKLGAVTDIDGKYTIQLAPGPHRMEYFMSGYARQEKYVDIKAGQTTTLNITLEIQEKEIDEVVVVGYGVQRKRDLTGSIAKIDGKKVNQFPVPSFEAALQGQAAGVQVSQGSGLAGSGSLVRVRGVASISAGGDPLYVIDGIPITQDQFISGNSGGMNSNPLANINPADIQSIEVLKDAAATGIYGSRGANGVILVTTKRGAAGASSLKFSFSTRFGVGTMASKPNMMTTDQYLAIRQEAWENDGGTGYVWLPTLTTANSSALEREQAYLKAKRINTNWVDQTTGIGLKQNYSFGVTKTTARDAIYAGISYDDNGSYLQGNSYNRASLRVNYDTKISEKFRLSTGASISHSVNHRVDAAWSGGLGLAMSTALPYYPVYDSTGKFFLWDNGYTNPVNYRVKRPWQYAESRALVNLSLIYSPIKDLNIKWTWNYDWLNGTDYKFNPKGVNVGTNDNFANANTNRTENYNSNITTDYTKKIGEKMRITGLAGVEYQQSSSMFRNLAYSNASGLPNQGGLTPADQSRTVQQTNAISTFQPSDRWRFGSVFLRFNWEFAKKYFVQAVYRVDASSKFGANKKTGAFPSISGGWVLSEEKFIKNIKFISFMKLRAGYGLVGNSNIPSNAQYATRLNGATYQGKPTLYPDQLPNPDLQWEKSTTLDVALETGFLKDRITVEVGAYRKYTTQALMQISIPASIGFSSAWRNTAEILNRGVELSITSYNISKKNFEWKTEFNISRNYNELKSIGQYTPDAVAGGTNDSRVIVGKPIGSFYLMKWSHVDPATGRPVYIDASGKETYTYSNFQRQFVGTGLPKAWGGLTNTFRFGNFDCQIFATWSLGAKIFDSSGKRQLGVVTDWNMRTEVFDRWRQPGDEATYPKLTLNETNYSLPSGFPWWNTSLFVYKADYLRLKNLAIGYNIPLARESKLTGLRVGFNITNLFTLTNFPGLDPEIVRDFENPADRNLSPNVTYLTPAQERSYNISLGMTF